MQPGTEEMYAQVLADPIGFIDHIIEALEEKENYEACADLREKRERVKQGESVIDLLELKITKLDRMPDEFN